MNYDLIIVGGGAAGFFTAVNVAALAPSMQIAILERGKEVLSKVRISGGGRCNVTHAEFIPKALTKYYPRGEKELIGPFHTFMTGDVMEWFEQRGVALKIEEDGRVFPVSDSSQTIIDCFLSEAQRLGITVLTSHVVQQFQQHDQQWQVTTNQGVFTAPKLMIATGSNPKIWKHLRTLQHDIVAAVPSLFTFNIQDHRIKDLPGVVAEARVRVVDTKLVAEGPLLITHWGMSGPAILKLSAWGAVALHAVNYDFEISVNWLLDATVDTVVADLQNTKDSAAKQQVTTYAQFGLPKRLWRSLVASAGIQATDRWAAIPKSKLRTLAQQLVDSRFSVQGKSTFKDEFVTAGGVALKEVHFKTFESKKHQHLYFAGEVLNIDAITGGFNFQNAWTGAYIAAQAIVDA